MQTVKLLPNLSDIVTTKKISMHSNIALVDDHILIRNGLSKLITSFNKYKILFEANNGKDLINKLKPDSLPDIVLMDINMPEMDGYEATSWLRSNYPEIKVLVLSMYDNENAIIRMFRSGAKGYILKDCDPLDLKEALNSLVSKGYYYSEMITGRLIYNINTNKDKDMINLSERETLFLKLVCTELTYKEIADKMFLSPRTIDGYRDDLFEKLNVKTRIGLALYAIKYSIVTL